MTKEAPSRATEFLRGGLAASSASGRHRNATTTQPQPWRSPFPEAWPRMDGWVQAKTHRQTRPHRTAMRHRAQSFPVTAAALATTYFYDWKQVREFGVCYPEPHGVTRDRRVDGGKAAHPARGEIPQSPEFIP